MSLAPNPPLYVNELIDSTSATWRADVLEKFFPPVDVQAIKTFPYALATLSTFGHGNLRTHESSMFDLPIDC